MSPSPARSHTCFLGIDIAKDSFTAHLLREDGGKDAASQFDNNPKGFAALLAWMRRLAAATPTVHAALEATGSYGMALLVHLHAAGLHVSYLNPRRVKDFTRSLGRRVKTDPADARDIALFAQRLRPQPWCPPAAEISTLQALVRHREDLVRQCGAVRNRLKVPGVPPLVTESLDRQLAALKDEIKLADSHIDSLVLEHLPLQKQHTLLQSIPGIGRIGAATLLAEVPHITSFARGRDVAAFAGVTPTLAQSGSSLRRRGSMSKEGSALLRKALYMAALNITKRPNAMRTSYERLVLAGKSKACALGALMNKLMRVAFGVLKHNTPFVENLAKI